MGWHVGQLYLIVSGVISDLLPGGTTDMIWHFYQLCLIVSDVISDLLPRGTTDMICLPLAICFVCQAMRWHFFWMACAAVELIDRNAYHLCI